MKSRFKPKRAHDSGVRPCSPYRCASQPSPGGANTICKRMLLRRRIATGDASWQRSI